MIPKRICQTWKTRNLDPKMLALVTELRKNNPEYDYVLFDDDDCKAFLYEHFGQNYVNAFEVLIPGAFKADLFRYCYLYVYGGVYIDIDMTPLVPLSQIVSPDDTFVSVVDRTVYNVIGIYQAFIASVPKHPILRFSLEIAFANIASRRSGLLETLSITGPGAMGVAVNLYWEKKNTNEKIRPGIYGDVKLYKNTGQYTYDLEGKKIFNNKYDGYSGENYALKQCYKDDPRQSIRHKILIAVMCVLLLLVIAAVGCYFFRRKWKQCASSKSSIEG